MCLEQADGRVFHNVYGRKEAAESRLVEEAPSLQLGRDGVAVGLHLLPEWLDPCVLVFHRDGAADNVERVCGIAVVVRDGSRCEKHHIGRGTGG